MGGVVGGIIGANQAKKYAAMSQGQMNDALKMLEAQGIPTVDAQKLILEKPELVGQYMAEQAGPSQMEGVKADQALVKAQRDALSGLQERGEVGLTAEDLGAFKKLSRDTSAQDQARQSNILQDMAARGKLDSGASLAAQLSSSQNAANAAEDQATKIASDAAAARREALGQSGSLAGQLRTQDVGEKTDVAKAMDQINAFNLQNRQSASDKNTSERQRIAEAQAATSNQQQQYNKQLLQQDYQNRMAKAQAEANIKIGQANQTAQQGQSIGQGYAQMGQGIDTMAGKIGGAIATGGASTALSSAAPAAKKATSSSFDPSAFEADAWFKGGIIKGNPVVDGDSPANDVVPAVLSPGEIVVPRSKTKDPQVAKDYVEEMLSKLKPSEYNYKADKSQEKHAGVMAQDLEKSELGKEYVTEDKDGMKMVDYEKMAPFMLAALAHLSKKIKDKK